MKLIYIIFVLGLGVISLNAQGFKAAAIGGINISQIDGDGYAGYHKWGLTGGARLSYEVYPKMDVSFEMLYSQRGSRNGRNQLPLIINLNYLEIPLIYSIKDWYEESEGYYKARADIGFSYGYLFNSSINAEGQEETLNNINTNDVSFVIGIGYNFNKRLGMGLRYSRSLFKMKKDQNLEYGGLLGYFLTARAEYNF